MPNTPDKQASADASPERIALGLSRLSVILKQEALRHSTLSPTQQQVLALVTAHQPGALTLKDIATNLGLKMPSISQSVSTPVSYTHLTLPTILLV